MEKRSRSRRRQPDKSLKKWILPLVFLFTVIIVGRRYMYYRAQYLKQAELDESLEYHPVPFEPEQDHRIEWTDRILEDKIRGVIDKGQGDIYLSDLWDCAVLRLNRDIYSARSEFVSDISSLAGLKNLRHLELNNNCITDISAVSTMENLDTLMLHGNRILDFSPLNSLARLDTLILSSTHLNGEDLECLSGLKNLGMLVLDFNDIESLDALRNLDIVFLSLKWNQITDIKPLAGLKEHLWYLVLDRNQIENIEPLAECYGLENLSLSYNHITDIEPLKNLYRLEILDLRNNNISELPDFISMTSLAVLRLQNNNITTEEWKKIRLPQSPITIYLSGNPITDLETDREYPFLHIVFEDE